MNNRESSNGRTADFDSANPSSSPGSRATTPTLTDAQKRALEWLPGDGEWKSGAGNLGPSLLSLFLWELRQSGRRQLVDRNWINGGDCFRWRLTKEGIALRKKVCG